MQKEWIKNAEDLSTTEARKKALQIISAGFDSIDTKKIIRDSISLKEDDLIIKDEKIDLKKIKRIIVIGFGKASATAGYEIEKILGDRIFDGVIIDLSVFGLKKIHGFKGTHPKPSQTNLEASEKIVSLSKGISKQDLVIVIISGGGSSLLCWPREELEQNSRLYDEFLQTGGNIEELNTVRKHISEIKGGGLAKIFYPAKIIGLIFCDIPGGKYEKVASGPTYKDTSTITNAENILKKYGLKGFNLNETPKEEIYFKNVTNIPMLSNEIALSAMAQKARQLGLNPKIMSSEIYGSAEEALLEMQNSIDGSDIILAGGEIKLIVKTKGGKGGRNQYLALKAVETIKDNEIFVSIASDGIDNSDSAGAITDSMTIEKIKEKNLNVKEYLDKYDTYTFFEETGDLIFTGSTGANVADLMLLLKDNG
jgi:glycerate 2-kinase